MDHPDVLPVILAAGRGTRLKSRQPKVLHHVCGQPMLQFVLDVVKDGLTHPPVVICATEQPEVVAFVEAQGGEIALQPVPNGTGGAIQALPSTIEAHEHCMILSGDVPLITVNTVKKLLAQHLSTGATATILTMHAQESTTLGQVIRSLDGHVIGIVEAADRASRQHTGNAPIGDSASSDGPNEYNAGIYVFRTRELLHASTQLLPSNAQHELYLTDVMALLDPSGVQALLLEDATEAFGVNTHRELAIVEGIMRQRICDRLMDGGVRVEDPSTTYCDVSVTVKSGTTIHPNCYLRGTITIGENCSIGPMAQLRDATIGEESTVGASTLEGCTVGNRVSIGQYARLRQGTVIGDDVLIGTAAEIKNSVVGKGSFISHFSCVLDANLGENVNIGAGTVTCNFDGVAKHRTIIGNGVFVGSDSILVAPRTIGDNAYIGAGSVITHDVAEGALAVERSQQVHIDGWVARRTARREQLQSASSTEHT